MRRSCRKISLTLRASENNLHNISKALGPHVMRSKGFIEIQKKLYDRLFELTVARTSGLQRLPLILSKTTNPKKILKTLPLRDDELEQFERILAGKEELDKLNSRFTNYLIYLEQIKNRRLELNRPNDYVDYTKFKYIGPGGVVHTKPSADPRLDTKYYNKVINQRISAPRTVNVKNLNNLKRVKHAEIMRGKTARKRKTKSKSFGMPKQKQENCTTHRFSTHRAPPSSSPRLTRQISFSTEDSESVDKRVAVTHQ